jgi:V/A-type H+/Na+-transporting ATPase subunit D
MGRIKHTKNELKAQRDALKRFERFLPTLHLKKQQLQVETRNLDVRIEDKLKEEEDLRRQLSSWVQFFSEPVDLTDYVQLNEIHTSTGNIAGVNIPVLDDLGFTVEIPDLLRTPPWIDDGIRVLKQLIQLRVEMDILRRQQRLLNDELRRTTQRVNLFEKVKIPEAREHIRVIRIFLGDEQTAEVARAKIAKGKSVAREEAA